MALFRALKPTIDSDEDPSGFKVAEPYDYQDAMLYHAINRRRCTFDAATAAGKSMSIYAILRWFLVAKKRRVLIIVPTAGLVTQLKGDFVAYSRENGWDASNKVHEIYSGKDKDVDTPVVVTTWQSMMDMPTSWFEWQNFGMVIVDEAHRAKGKELQGILGRMETTEYRIGLTGTIPPNDADRLTVTSMIGPVVHIIKPIELIESNRATPVDIICCVLKYPDHIRAQYNPHEWPLKENGDKMDGKDMFVIERRYLLQECAPRRKWIASLCGKLHGNTLVVSTDLDAIDAMIAEIQAIYPDASVHKITGNVKADIREDIRKQVNHERKGNIIVATPGCMATGINLPHLHNIVLAATMQSYEPLTQLIGRGLRKATGKDVCRFYDIVDDMCIKGKRGAVKKNFMYRHFENRLGLFSAEGFPFRLKNVELEFPDESPLGV